MSLMRRFLSDRACIFAEWLDNPRGLKDRGFTISGNPEVVNSQWGKALSCGGSDYITVKHNNKFNFGTGDISIFFPIRLTTSGQNGWIFNSANVVHDANIFEVRFTSADNIRCLAGAGSGSRSYRDTATEFTLNVWYTFGALWDNSAGTINLYLNGSSDQDAYGEQNGAGQNLTNTEDKQIGSRISNPMYADIPFMIIWTRLLSTKEISNLVAGKVF